MKIMTIIHQTDNDINDPHNTFHVTRFLKDSYKYSLATTR